MFVCLCKGITDHDIRDAIDEGATSFRALQKRLGVSTQCGSCECEAREVLAEYKQMQREEGLFYAA